MNDLTVNASDANNSDNLLDTIASNYVDLASKRIGGETIACSDDFFAEMENLIKPGRGIFIDDKYTDRGKWMDGWESRRSYGRDNGREFDWCVIRLGTPGIIKAVDVDTNFFRGNAPAQISIEGCVSLSNPDENTQWTEILTKHDTNAHSQNVFAVQSDQVWTHVRLNIFPDGGVARFRVYGEVVADWDKFLAGELIDVAAITNGGKALVCSDMFFSDKNNLIMPGRGKDMGDGWETKRRRDPGPDWIIIELAKVAKIKKVLIDTCHFKGNFPDTFKLEGVNVDANITALDNVKWQTIIDQTKLYADREQWFVVEDNVNENVNESEQSFTHVRLNIYPDGGVSRMRIMGYVG